MGILSSSGLVSSAMSRFSLLLVVCLLALEVAAQAPSFSKAFAPASIPLGGTATLTFTIDNTGALVAAASVDFTDNLPAGMVVATPANVVNTCTGGTVTAVGASGFISYTGGTVPAASSCTITVDVTGTSLGGHVNTSGDLTSSLGNSGSATDTLTVTSVTPPTPL